MAVFLIKYTDVYLMNQLAMLPMTALDRRFKVRRRVERRELGTSPLRPCPCFRTR